MKRLLAMVAILALGLGLTTPAVAGHRDRYRGHGWHTHSHLRGKPCRVVHDVYRPRGGVFFGFGHPGLFGFYAAPVHYEPFPVLAPVPVWVPGHFVHRRGVRIWVQGHWSR
jgi:hypothetical protein